ncbi:MAG TPA: hypothetical protein VFN55_04310 [Solirubrobacteraceae bacterium]|nr:hypothetical protein [Solirubrobacteraceae bacterium]
MRAISEWGTRPSERTLEFACDRVLSGPSDALYRAISVHASAPILYRWLCQLRAAPYSYDWIDNRGRRSPDRLTPGLEELELGQPVARVFRLADFEPDRQLTLQLARSSVFVRGVAITYLIVPEQPDRCRLVAKLRIAYPATLTGRLVRALLPAGDLVMMRRQLMTFRTLAERDERSRPASAA